MPWKAIDWNKEKGPLGFVFHLPHIYYDIKGLQGFLLNQPEGLLKYAILCAIEAWKYLSIFVQLPRYFN